VQIGGGVRVGDAFQAIVGFKLIAIWVSEICVEISQAGRTVSFALIKRNRHRPTDGTEGVAHERVEMSGRSEWRYGWTN
jgi:hypothetical protein